MKTKNETPRGQDVARIQQDTSEAILPPVQEIINLNFKVQPFVDHVRKVFSKPDLFLDYIANIVQRPLEKQNKALILVGPQGASKDIAIEFCIPAIGSRNVRYATDSPNTGLLSTNKFANHPAKFALLFISNDNSDINRFLRNKKVQELIADASCGVIITTLRAPEICKYIFDNDVIECKEVDDYIDLRKWFEEENGSEHIAAFLREREVRHDK